MKNILVVVDMQNDFLTGKLANPDAVAIVPGIVEEIESGKYDEVYATLDEHFDDYLNTVEGKHLPVPHCMRGTPGAELCPAIKEAIERGKNCRYHRKRTFGSIALAYILGHDVEMRGERLSITLVGTCTDICVISNALILKTLRKAEVNVIERLCAGTTRENHENAIKAMRQCHVNIL